MAKSNQPDPAALWDHDRRLIANWLLREAGGGFDGVERRGDGSTFIQFGSALGPVSVHDYWSFARRDFVIGQRLRSYQEALQRQVPVLSFGYTRPELGAAQLVVFLCGELDITKGAQGFALFLASKAPGQLVAIETISSNTQSTEVSLYSDPLLITLMQTVRQQTQRLPSV